MRVLLPTLDSPATLRGGVEWYVHHLARHLRAEGVEARVLARKPRDTPPDLLDEVDYEWVRLPSPRGPVTHRYRLVMQPFFDRGVAHAARRWGDIVHGQNLDAAGALGIRPVVSTVHTTELDEWESSRLRGWREAVYQRHLHEAKLRRWRHMAQRGRHFLSPATHVAQSLLELGAPAERVEVFPNPIDPLPQMSRASARSHLDLPPGPVVLYLGRLARVKRVDRLLHAVAQMEGVRLVVAGDGPESEELRRLGHVLKLDQRVRFEGRVDDQRKTLLLNAADAFCLPSEHEGQPLALLEAISLGVPVVATRAEWVPAHLQARGLWGEDLVPLLDQALRQGRGPGGGVPDYRDLARRMATVYNEALEGG